MKKVFTIVLLAVCSHAFAQQDSLKAYNNLRIKTTSNGLLLLGGWGLVNLGSGAVLGWSSGTSVTVNVDGNTVSSRSGAISPEGKYFLQMNTIWGSVNFVTALIGYTGTQKDKNSKNLSAAQVLEKQKRMEKIFKVNSFLDMGYVGAGLYLKLAGDSRNSPQMKGYGESLLMQGGFLLIFDGLMYNAEKHNGSKLRSFLEKHPMTFDGRRVGIVFQM